ncbi:hypothetical protein P7C73_g3011, partial [Tremellales sp. Uapishka_1]
MCASLIFVYVLRIRPIQSSTEPEVDSQVKSFPALLKSLYGLLRPSGLLLIFDQAFPPSPLATGPTTGVQAWSDAYHKSLRNAGMTPFNLEAVMRTCLQFSDGKVGGNQVRVPIGGVEGGMNQLGRLHQINVEAYLGSARYILMEYGRYTESEADVLTEAFTRGVASEKMYMTYHALTIRKKAVAHQVESQ